MGLTSGDERNALLDLAKEATKRTSFSRQLAQQATIYDRQRSQQRLIQDLAGAVAPPPGTDAAKAKTLADVKIVAQLPKGHGFNPAGYYHHIAVDFSLGPQGNNVPSPAFTTQDEKDERDAWGTTWEKDLINPRKSTVYMVRATLSQLRVEPLVGGFILRWVRPVGWTWVDGQAVQIPVQVASNPLVMIRLVLSPSTTIIKAGFTVSVKAQYP